MPTNLRLQAKFLTKDTHVRTHTRWAVAPNAARFIAEANETLRQWLATNPTVIIDNTRWHIGAAMTPAAVNTYQHEASYHVTLYDAATGVYRDDKRLRHHQAVIIVTGYADGSDRPARVAATQLDMKAAA